VTSQTARAAENVLNAAIAHCNRRINPIVPLGPINLNLPPSRISPSVLIDQVAPSDQDVQSSPLSQTVRNNANAPIVRSARSAQPRNLIVRLNRNALTVLSAQSGLNVPRNPIALQPRSLTVRVVLSLAQVARIAPPAHPVVVKQLARNNHVPNAGRGGLLAQQPKKRKAKGRRRRSALLNSFIS
jgi:hypothetical protein